VNISSPETPFGDPLYNLKNHRLAKRHIRGSSLLLSGRMFSLIANFFVQVLVVRYLSMHDYGAFAYAISIVYVCVHIAGFGLSRAVSRFVPIYHEKRDFSAMFGTIVFSIGSVLGLGVVVVLAVTFFHGLIGRAVVREPLSLDLLLILISIAPFQSADELLQALLASLSKPRAIFFRRYILAPLLKLSAIILVMLIGKDVRFLAFSFLIAEVLGSMVSFILLWRILQQQDLLKHFHLRSLTIHLRKILGFSLPLLTVDMNPVFKTTLAIILLGKLMGPEQVAEFRAVLPVAGLSLIVYQSFKLLFIPTASRLLVNGDVEGLNKIFWQTSIWTTIITFPIFAGSFLLAKPVTVMLFSNRYAEAGGVLAWLTLGQYFNAAIGLNSQTLQVYGRVGFVAVVNVSTLFVALGLNLLLIPKFGAVGAAMATCAALVTHNLLNHSGLLTRTDVRVLDRCGLRVYGSVVLCTIGLHLVLRVLDLSFVSNVIIVAVAALLLIRINRDILAMDSTFPELNRIPLLRFLMERRRGAPRLGKEFLYHFLNAVVTAPLYPKRKLSENLFSFVSPSTRRYHRVASGMHLVERIFSGTMRRTSNFLCDLNRIPARAAKVKLLAFGSGSTVFLLEQGERRGVLKIYRRSLGRRRNELMEVISDFQRRFRVLSSWYGNMGLIHPSLFLLVHGPFFGTPAAACVQSYIEGEKSDFFTDHSDGELLTILREDAVLRRQFTRFAQRTIDFCVEKGSCVDFLGHANLMLVDRNGRRSLVLLDYGIFELNSLHKNAPAVYHRLIAYISRMEKLMRELSVEERPHSEVQMSDSGYPEAHAMLETV